MIFSEDMIPSYILIRNYKMMKTVLAILFSRSISIYKIIVTRTFFQNSISLELLEASKLDSCSDAQFFFRVLLPLSSATNNVNNRFIKANKKL